MLEGINLTGEAGQTVAILGATGAGKSSPVNLIPRFYDVAEGHVLIDGVDIRDVSQESLLSRIGVVPQETVLFRGVCNQQYGAPQGSSKR